MRPGPGLASGQPEALRARPVAEPPVPGLPVPGLPVPERPVLRAGAGAA